MKTNSQLVADSIYNLLLVTGIQDKNSYVEPFINGREVGYTIVNTDSVDRISFAEHRSSDDIVVYKGNSDNLMMGEKRFAFGRLDLVVEYILDLHDNQEVR